MEYGIKPWEMARVTLRELDLIVRRERRLEAEARKAGR